MISLPVSAMAKEGTGGVPMENFKRYSPLELMRSGLGDLLERSGLNRWTRLNDLRSALARR